MLQILMLQFKNLSIYFYVALFCVCGIVGWLSYIGGSYGLELFVAILGIMYAFFAGEGKLVCFVFGLIYSAMYAYIAFEARLYGDAMLNLFYLPINILGLWLWNQNQKEERVAVRFLGLREIVLSLCVVVVLGVGYGEILKSANSAFAYLNAFSVVLQILAFYLQAKRYVENYLFVSIANVLSVLMWGFFYYKDSAALPQLLNMCVFLGIGLWYWRIWISQARGGLVR